MSNRRWHILRSETEVTLARHLPARFDVAAETDLPAGSPVRLAQQIRQDMWRQLQSVRGFSPVVRLTVQGDGWRVRAGGRVQGQMPPDLAERIAAVLENPTKRSRWVAQANRHRAAK